MNLEYNNVVQALNKILEDPNYEGIELEVVRCKKIEVLQVHRLRLKFPKKDSKMRGRAGDIARKLNSALELKDKAKFKLVNTNDIKKWAHIRLVNNGNSQNTKSHCLVN